MSDGVQPKHTATTYLVVVEEVEVKLCGVFGEQLETRAGYLVSCVIHLGIYGHPCILKYLVRLFGSWNYKKINSRNKNISDLSGMLIWYLFTDST